MKKKWEYLSLPMLRNAPIEIKEGAVIVADAHYASYRPSFKTLLEKIQEGEIQTTQIILLGDIVDLLIADIKIFQEYEKELIALINLLAEKKEIIYLEGNHDFMLQGLFPKVRVVPISQQPSMAIFNGSHGWLAHGDWKEPLLYRVYTFTVRRVITVTLYKWIDCVSKKRLSRFLREKMRLKSLCRKFDDFEQRVRDKITPFSLEGSWFIEGHYHQGIEFEIAKLRYFNLDAMACNKSFFVVQSNNNEIVLSKRIL